MMCDEVRREDLVLDEVEWGELVLDMGNRKSWC